MTIKKSLPLPARSPAHTSRLWGVAVVFWSPARAAKRMLPNARAMSTPAQRLADVIIRQLLRPGDGPLYRPILGAWGPEPVSRPRRSDFPHRKSALMPAQRLETLVLRCHARVGGRGRSGHSLRKRGHYINVALIGFSLELRRDLFRNRKRGIMRRSTGGGSGLSRRNFLVGAGGLGLTGLLDPSRSLAMGPAVVELPFANGQRNLVSTFPQKGAMILQRTSPPLLETPF